MTGLERTLEQLREVMERDYIGIIKKRLDDVYRTSSPPGTNVRGDKVERENRIAFIVRVVVLLGFSRSSQICPDSSQRPGHIILTFGTFNAGYGCKPDNHSTLHGRTSANG